MSKENAVRNLGEASWRMLRAAGIPDDVALRRIGPAMAFAMVRAKGGHASLNLLWAMAAGLQGRDWRELNEEEKGRLLREVEDCAELLRSGPAVKSQAQDP